MTPSYQQNVRIVTCWGDYFNEGVFTGLLPKPLEGPSSMQLYQLVQKHLKIQPCQYYQPQ